MVLAHGQTNRSVEQNGQSKTRVVYNTVTCFMIKVTQWYSREKNEINGVSQLGIHIGEKVS